MQKPITILYFAWLRERTGTSQEEFVLTPGVETVSDLLDALGKSRPHYAAAFQDRQTIRCAINQEFASPSSPINPGDEVAFFPPVTGG